MLAVCMENTGRVEESEKVLSLMRKKQLRRSLGVVGLSKFTGTLKGYNQLLNPVLDEAIEFLRVADLKLEGSSGLRDGSSEDVSVKGSLERPLSVPEI
ncbi:hypothetical protein CKAN_00866100 [Cinnamomum micranthum f. kanehirae]|uniref:Uncharacterized protein n=1 Tax=Cinnamomum micranthum f. kanehirae TaxID=337451 RepID=A0A443NNJ2_9MAGN|nr:hypothetical protein CKAN_00866100 [Cinnamomum micranthum f. kanehirae]